MRDRWLGPLGIRLFAAFVLVAVASVGTLTAAAVITTTQGVDAREQQQRDATTQAIADRLAKAYTAANGWTNADLTAADTIAEAANVRYFVRAGSAIVARGGVGIGMGLGMGMGLASQQVTDSPRWTAAEIRSADALVGTLSVGFATALQGAGAIAWSWIILAAFVALVVAFGLAVFVSRRIARPMLRISSAAQRFANGDRTARTDPQDAASRWELGGLARAFDETAENVVRSEESRRRIAADVAHELRTPMTVLQAGLEEVRDGLVPADAEHLGTLHAQAVRLGRIVEDLASLAAAETAALSMRLADADLAEIARQAHRAALPLLDGAGIASVIDAEHEMPVRVDEDRMHQAIANLLTNAARHCRRGDRVLVTVHRRDGLAECIVADTGPGIPEAEVPHVFERLWRGSASRDTDGSGIGLAVVRELVEAQHGTVHAARNADGGMTFTIAMPLV